MNTILFDIDGTLVRSGGAGMVAIEQVMKEMFELDSIGSVAVHGRTDNGIFNDLFDQHSLSYDQYRDEFNARYWELLPETLKQKSGTLLPGVVDLLNVLVEQDDIALGVLTGNSCRAANIKLQHFGLDQYFDFGGYGDVHSNRNEVAGLAFRSAREHLKDRFDPSQLWVVGDTVNDVICARSIEARVLAVETGGGCKLALAESEPDCQLESLANVDSFLRAVGASIVH